MIVIDVLRREKMNNFLTVIDFVRGFTQHEGKDGELLKTVKEEIKLCKKYNFPNTFLLQYDAMIRKDFQDIFFSERDENMELGVWIEIVKPLVEACGMEWRGRPGYDWDFYVNPGFLMAYTKKEKEILCDEVMRKFKELFGEFPKCVGSWMLDSYSMEYMSKKYDLSAFCVCREQYGVDGYSLWGGYYNQGYYPSKYNMLCPAQSEECQINVPVFRMLGIDPMYEYDNKRYETKWRGIRNNGKYPIYTFEPAVGPGRDRDYAEWYLNSYGSDKTVNYSYIQHGQENSFWWDELIEAGWELESEVIDGLTKEKKLKVLKFSEMGEWYKANFKKTPPTSIVAETDWAENGLKSFWYSCKNYRTNVFVDNDTMIIRDIYKFDEKYKERYYDEVCTGRTALYDNLPVMDGVFWSDEETRSGIFFEGKISDVEVEKEENNQIISAKLDNEDIKIVLSEEGIEIFGKVKLEFRMKKDIEDNIELKDNKILFNHNSYDYFVEIGGELSQTDCGFAIESVDNKIFIKMNI